jgi:hypothetical protein
MILIPSYLLSSTSSNYLMMVFLHTMHTQSHPFCSRHILSFSLATLPLYHSSSISVDIQLNSLVVLARYKEWFTMFHLFTRRGKRKGCQARKRNSITHFIHQQPLCQHAVVLSSPSVKISAISLFEHMKNTYATGQQALTTTDWL